MKDFEIPKELLDSVHDCIKSSYDEGYRDGIESMAGKNDYKKGLEDAERRE